MGTGSQWVRVLLTPYTCLLPGWLAVALGETPRSPEPEPAARFQEREAVARSQDRPRNESQKGVSRVGQRPDTQGAPPGRPSLPVCMESCSFRKDLN